MAPEAGKSNSAGALKDGGITFGASGAFTTLATKSGNPPPAPNSVNLGANLFIFLGVKAAETSIAAFGSLTSPNIVAPYFVSILPG